MLTAVVLFSSKAVTLFRPRFYTRGMIHISKLHILLFRKDNRGRGQEFSLSFIKSNGHIVKVERAICTSFYSRGQRFNIRILPSGEIRQVKLYSIIEFNHARVYV